MENITTNKNNVAAGNMHTAAGVKKKNRKSKKKTKTRPKLKPVAVNTLPAVNEDDDLENGLGYGDIMVVPPPTPRDKLQSDLRRLEEQLGSLPKFTPTWFEVKANLTLVQMKLDEWDKDTPTAAKMETPVVTTEAAYQEFLQFVTNEEDSKSAAKGEGQPLQQKDQSKKKKKSSRKIRPKLKPQSVVEKEDGDEEDGLGFNDILLTKRQNSKTLVVDEHTTLLDQVAVANAEECQVEVRRSSNVGEWLIRGVICTILLVLAFKYLLP
jgi:phosphoglycerate-specific signal transduction histidine kinase